MSDEYHTRERECGNNLKIEYSKKTVKYINFVDKSTKKRLKEAIEKSLLEILKDYRGLKTAIV